LRSSVALQATSSPANDIPPPQTHPLPVQLAKWQAQESDDYFDQIAPSEMGYLIWSHFPVKVYIEPPQVSANGTFAANQQQTWVAGIQQAVRDWSVYLPLTIVDSPEQSDITVLRSTPPLRVSGESGKSQPRARTAETRYEFYLKKSVEQRPILYHRCSILLRSNQPANHLLATARHEIGHALGIWGHSPQPTDALYFSQVRNPPQISARDVNTLRRIYEQPTRLGWFLP
jgi:predicted Zn-dependent protease